MGTSLGFRQLLDIDTLIQLCQDITGMDTVVIGDINRGNGSRHPGSDDVYGPFDEGVVGLQMGTRITTVEVARHKTDDDYGSENHKRPALFPLSVFGGAVNFVYFVHAAHIIPPVSCTSCLMDFLRVHHYPRVNVYSTCCILPPDPSPGNRAPEHYPSAHHIEPSSKSVPPGPEGLPHPEHPWPQPRLPRT